MCVGCGPIFGCGGTLASARLMRRAKASDAALLGTYSCTYWDHGGACAGDRLSDSSPETGRPNLAAEQPKLAICRWPAPAERRACPRPGSSPSSSLPLCAMPPPSPPRRRACSRAARSRARRLAAAAQDAASDLRGSARAAWATLHTSHPQRWLTQPSSCSSAQWCPVPLVACLNLHPQTWQPAMGIGGVNGALDFGNLAIGVGGEGTGIVRRPPPAPHTRGRAPAFSDQRTGRAARPGLAATAMR